MAVHREAAERAVADLLAALGHAHEHCPDLEHTPRLVVEALTNELLCGYRVDPAALIRSGNVPATGSGQLVVVKDLHVATLCPHHLMPATGMGSVAYQPGDSVLGLGVIARLLDAYSRRLTLQETIGDNVVQALVQFAGAKGAWCRLELAHTCLSTRGQRREQSRVITVARAGSLCESADQAEQLRLALAEE